MAQSAQEWFSEATKLLKRLKAMLMNEDARQQNHPRIFGVNVQVLRVTSTTPTSGRYPAKIQLYDGGFSDGADAWVVEG